MGQRCGDRGIGFRSQAREAIFFFVRSGPSGPGENTFNAELNPFCHLPALLRAHYILHVSRIRVKQTAIKWVLKSTFWKGGGGGGKRGPELQVITDTHLVPSLRMHGATPPLFLFPSKACHMFVSISQKFET